MSNLKYFFVLLLSVFTLQSFAQDRMYKKNGDIVEIKLIRLTPTEITFKRFDTPDGPEYTIPKGDVIKIRYANGSSDVFEENNDRMGLNDEGKPMAPVMHMDKRSAPKDQNMIGFSPLAFTENGYGFSLSYERTLDKRGWVSFYFPIYFTFQPQTSTDYSGVQTAQNFSNPMVYFMPGMKFYTNLNGPSRMKHSIALNLVMAFGNNTADAIDYYGTNNGPTTKARSLIGALVSYGGTMFPTNHLFFGYDVGLGMSYLNHYDGVEHGITGLFQASIRCGYRFTKKVK